MDNSRRIRVLFPYAGGNTVGGSHVSSLTLAAGLDRRFVLPIILLHGTPGAIGHYIENLGLSYMQLERPPVLTARFKRRPGDATAAGYLVRTIPALVRLLRREAIDVVHTNDGSMHWTWALPARLAGARFVWHHRQDPDARGVNFVAPLVADRILSVSHFARPASPIRDVSDRFEVVRSPFDLSRPPDRAGARAALLAEVGAPPEALLLGYVGTLTHRKRPEHFVRVVAETRAALAGRRPVHGLIFGREEVAGLGIEARCRELVRSLGLAGHLHIMGHRSPPEPLIAGIDVLVVTALSEPFGRTLIEAMNLGTPVVATRHGGNPEAIVHGKSGFLVDPARPEAFVPPILRLLDVPEERRRLTAQAAEFARGLTTEAHVDRVTEIYRDLVAGARQGAQHAGAGASPGGAGGQRALDARAPGEKAP